MSAAAQSPSLRFRAARRLAASLGIAASIVMTTGVAYAQDESDVAVQLTNPIANLIQMPFHHNFDLGGGHSGDAARYTMNFQPVIPVRLNSDWNLISRTIIPFTSWSGVFPHTERGVSDIAQSFFFSPAGSSPSGTVWGAGPILLLPTGTNDVFSRGQWAAGPTGVALQMKGAWTYGVLANHLWSVSAAPAGLQRVNASFFQPFLTYTLPTQTTVFVTSEATHDWNARQWTVPINVGLNQLVSIGGQMVQFGGLVRYYAEKPAGGPTWGFQFRMVLIFPVP